MVNRQIEGLTAATELALDDRLPVVDRSDTSDPTDGDSGGTTKQTTLTLLNTFLASTIQTLTNKTINTASNTITIVEADISDLQAYITASSTDTLTNKTIDLGTNTLTGTKAQFDTACSDDGFAFVSDNLSVFAATTSAQLAGVISDETGSGALVFGTSPALSSPVLTTPQINDTSSDHQYIFGVSELLADRTVTLPLLTGNDTFVFEAFAQTLTNKTIDAANNTLTGTAAEFDTACSDDNFAFVSDNLSVFAATTSAQLAGVISDETGSGALVFATAPTLGPTVTISDSATTPPLNVTERSAAPSAPSSGDIYLDDGTNTASGNPGWRRYTGAAWEDISAGAGGGGSPGGSDTQLQYNNGGAFGGVASMTYNDSNGTLTIEDDTAPPLTIRRTGFGSGVRATLYLKAKHSSDIADTGFGPQLAFQVQDDGTDSNIGVIECLTNGAETSGQWKFGLSEAGTNRNVLTITDTVCEFGLEGASKRSYTFNRSGSATTKLQLFGDTAADSTIGQRRAAASVFGPYQYFEKARGSLASLANVNDSDLCGGPNFWFRHTNTWRNAGSIQGFAQSASGFTGGIALFTGAVNSLTDAKMVLRNAGLVGIGTTTPGATLHTTWTTTTQVGCIINAPASQSGIIFDVRLNNTSKLKVGSGGITDFADQASAPPTATGAGTADDWLEIKMNGTQYWIPLMNS